MTKTASASIAVFDSVLAFLEDEGIDALVVEEGVAIKAAFFDDIAEWVCNIEIAPISEATYALAIFSRWPNRPVTDEAQRARLWPLLNALNARALTASCLEIDPTDGEITLRSCVPCAIDCAIPGAIVHAALVANWGEFEICLEALDAMLSDENATVDDVVAAALGE